jgi:hypothetical protein
LLITMPLEPRFQGKKIQSFATEDDKFERQILPVYGISTHEFMKCGRSLVEYCDLFTHQQLIKLDG